MIMGVEALVHQTHGKSMSATMGTANPLQVFGRKIFGHPSLGSAIPQWVSIFLHNCHQEARAFYSCFLP